MDRGSLSQWLARDEVDGHPLGTSNVTIYRRETTSVHCFALVIIAQIRLSTTGGKALATTSS